MIISCSGAVALRDGPLSIKNFKKMMPGFEKPGIFVHYVPRLVVYNLDNIFKKIRYSSFSDNNKQIFTLLAIPN